MAINKKKEKKKKKKLLSDRAIAKIRSTYNNTIITISDTNSNTISWASGGTVGYTGSKKSTPYAAQIAADQLGKDLIKMGLKKLDIEVNGPGPGKEAAIRTFQASGLEVNNIKDTTSNPHNGCRPKKRRGM